MRAKNTSAHPLETVGMLARRLGLSRSTLLYYDRIGLVRPSARSESRYRLYDQDDVRRLESLCQYRALGLSLAEIGRVLDGGGDETSRILQRRFEALQVQVAGLKEQQRVVARLLGARGAAAPGSGLDKATWVRILRATGLSDEEMDRWHVEFERTAPQAHQEFLQSLFIDSREIASIRRRSRI